MTARIRPGSERSLSHSRSQGVSSWPHVAVPPRLKAEALAMAVTFGFFAILVVGTNPFIGGSGISIDKTGHGDELRQLIIVFLFLVSVPILVVRRRAALRILRSNPPIVMLFGWGLLSVLWSSVPDIALRRMFGTILCGELSLVAATLAPRHYLNFFWPLPVPLC